jgi:hypothetical protein
MLRPDPHLPPFAEEKSSQRNGKYAEQDSCSEARGIMGSQPFGRIRAAAFIVPGDEALASRKLLQPPIPECTVYRQVRGQRRAERCGHVEAGVSGAGDGRDGSNILHLASLMDYLSQRFLFQNWLYVS